ncbi:hypothetical protein [Salininema proteolyticum]|uniref:Uncharacterized protein n=1 Tax=Salininema proteolyticum TaxID=1607685 RepID=A0ABV8U3A9_9ACTN
MSGFSVDPEVLEGAAKKLREAMDYTDKAIGYSEEADPDLWMRGLPGVAFKPISEHIRPVVDEDLADWGGEAGSNDVPDMTLPTLKLG